MELEKRIDHTLLKIESTIADIHQLCAEAQEANFAAVCVPPYFVPDAVSKLQGHPCKIATVIGFPLGYSATAAKVEEIKRAIDEGADELDVVVNITAVKNGNWNFVYNDIDRMTTACHLKGKLIKVIIETSLLTEAEMKKLCEICSDLSVDFVKTSTGFNGPGASVEVVKLLKENLKKGIKIKASGGIRTHEDAVALIEAGADRLGTSSGLKIMAEIS